MAKKNGSLLTSFFAWAANQLLGPRLRHADWVRSELLQSLSQTLAMTSNEPAVSLAILEGAMAIAMADGEFEQEEWELYSSFMGQLQLLALRWCPCWVSLKKVHTNAPRS